MLPDRVLNPGPLTYKSGALPIALRGPAKVTRFSGPSCHHPRLILANCSLLDVDTLVHSIPAYSIPGFKIFLLQEFSILSH